MAQLSALGDMRPILQIILMLTILAFVSCSRAPQFDFSDQSTVTFINRNPMHREELILGASARASFIQTVRQPESDFDSKLLQLSAPMGIFKAGDIQFEYHLGLLVYRDGNKVHIWQSDFTHQLGEMLLKTNASWREMLKK